jgi:2-polyprenyl-3-methyl-5-hydroxy-6-metoxy-1,4-benzoquinol methylase
MHNTKIVLAESEQTSPESESTNKSLPVTDPNILKLALAERLKKLIAVQGEFHLPCMPTMLDEYLKLITGFLKLLGQQFTQEEADALQKLIANNLSEGFRTSPHSRLILNYKPADAKAGLASGITINTAVHVESVADNYETWPQLREEPLFGSHPDAKVMAVATELGDPSNSPILDVGAGPGRNSLPLAKLGYPVDAIELTPIFAQKLSDASTAEGLPVNVTQGNVLDPLLRMRIAHYRLAIAAEVVSHFRYTEQVRLFLAKMCDALQSGGLLLFSAFIAADGYEPDDMVREMSEVSWSYLITRSELLSAMEGLPLEMLSEESVIEYEQSHLPKEAWPPTTWFVNWATGRDLFPIQQQPPMELRWLLARRR